MLCKNPNTPSFSSATRDCFQYTAFLLVCDMKTGITETFYSAKGSFGGELDVSGNTLKWNTESIVLSGYSPYTSSFSVGFNCKVFRYSFDKTGALLDCEETGEIARNSK